MSQRQRRPRLFAFPPDVELAQLGDGAPTPAARLLLEELLTTFYEVSRSKKLGPDDLTVVLEACVSPHELLQGIATSRLAVLSHYFPEAGEALEDLVQHPAPAVRRLAIPVLANAETTTATRGLRLALQDAEVELRKLAADAAGAVALPGLGEALDQALGREPDARVRVRLQLAQAAQARWAAGESIPGAW